MPASDSAVILRLSARDACLALLAALLTVYPFFIYDIGGDIPIHHTYIRCFAEHVWQGDLYPRWCADVRMATGAPVFLFYFPVPYWITSLFYPLTWAGVTMAQLYILMAGICGAVTFLGARRWLAEVSQSVPIARLGAFFYLLLVYRSDLLYARGAYSEMWLLAFLPWFLLYFLRLCRGDLQAAPAGCASLTLCLLCNFTSMFSIGVALAAYAIVTVRDRLSWKGLVMCAGVGLAVTAFYTAPAIYYTRFIIPVSEADLYYLHPNRPIRPQDLKNPILVRVILGNALTLIAAGVLFIWILLNGRKLPGGRVRRECAGWAGVFLCAALFVLPPGSFLWDESGALKTVLFPWRMQAVYGVALTVFFVVARRWLPGKKSSRYDTVLLFGFLALLPHYLVSVRAEKDEASEKFFTEAVYPNSQEYKTIWLDGRRNKIEFFMERYLQGRDMDKITILSGEATARLTELNSRRIMVEVNAKEAARIMIEHIYFPIWHVRQEEGREVALSPQEGTGFMQLSLPPGEYTVTLYRDIGEGAPAYVRLAPWASVLTLIAIALYSWRNTWRRALTLKKPDAK